MPTAAGASPLTAVREERLAQGGGMGRDPDTRLKLTSRCQHLKISEVQPWRQLVQLQLVIPTRKELNREN